MKKSILIEGGIGKQIALTWPVLEFAKNNETQVISPHSYLWEWLIETHNTNKEKLFETVIKWTELIILDPYLDFDVYTNEKNIINTTAKILGIENKYYEPQIKLSIRERNDANEWQNRTENREWFILFQPFGAMSWPHGDPSARSLEKEFATELAFELNKIAKTYYVWLNDFIPQIPPINWSIRQIIAVAQKAKFIICCDSFLHHWAKAVGNNNVITIWGGTSEKVYWHEWHHHIREFNCPWYNLVRFVNDSSVDEAVQYSNKFTEKTFKKIKNTIYKNFIS